MRTIIAVLTALSSLPATAAPRGPLAIRCLSAGGFYGAASLTEVAGFVEVTLKNGLELSPESVARSLELLAPDDGAFISTVAVKFPATDCSQSPDDALVVRCVGRNLELAFHGDKEMKTTVRGVSIDLTRVVSTSVDGRRDGIAVTFAANGPGAVYGSTAQTFGFSNELGDQGCVQSR